MKPQEEVKLQTSRATSELKKLLMRTNILSFRQAKYALAINNDYNPEFTLNHLLYENRLFEVRPGYVSVAYRDSYSENLIEALWLMLNFANDVEFSQCYVGMAPAELFFILNDTMYEVIVVDEGREGTIITQLKYHHKKDNANNDDIHYILIVNDTKQIRTIDMLLYENDMDINIAFAVDEGMKKVELPGAFNKAKNTRDKNTYDKKVFTFYTFED